MGKKDKTKAKGGGPPKDQERPGLEPEDMMRISSERGIHYARAALAKGDLHVPEGGGFPEKQFIEDSGKHFGSLELRPISPEEEPTTTGKLLRKLQEEMAAQVRRLSPEVGHLLNIVLWLWMNPNKRDTDGSIILSANDVLRLRGIKEKTRGGGRRIGYALEDKRRIAEQLSILHNAWLTLITPQYKTAKKGDPEVQKPARGRYLKSRIVIVEAEAGQQGLDGQLSPDRWRIRVGRELAQYLDSDEGRAVMLLSRKALKYNPRTEKREILLSWYLSWLWRVRASKPQSEIIYVWRLLKETGDLTGEPINYSPHNYMRDREALEKALDQLTEDGNIARWVYVEAAEEDGPDHVWRSHEWVNKRLLIVPPEVLRAYYAKLAQQSEKRKALQAARRRASGKNRPWSDKERESLVGIRFGPKASWGDYYDLKISQRDAARSMGISQAQLQRIEDGRLTPTGETLQKVRAWMAKISAMSDEERKGLSPSPWWARQREKWWERQNYW